MSGLATQAGMFRGSESSGLWTPAEISTALWLDFADQSTLFEDELGTIPATSAVGRVNDKSGSGNYFRQTIASRQFTVGVNTLNGLSVLNSVGDSDMSSISLISEPEINFFILRRVSSSDNRSIDLSGNNNQYTLISENNAATTSLSLAFGSPTFYKDGELQSFTTRDDAHTAFHTDNFHINGQIGGSTSGWVDFQLGYGVNATSSWRIVGDYAEVIGITGTLTTILRQTVEGYLAHKWGLESNLPAAHPFKTNPPTV